VPAPRLRLVLAISIDGRLAPPEGGAAQIGGRGDRRVLEEALTWADGVLIGAETLRRHGSTCLIHAPDLLDLRRRQDRSPQPTALVVSRSGRIPSTLAFFRQPLERWLVLADPGPSAASGAASAPGFARVLGLGSWPQLLAELAAAGLERIVVLGGALLVGSLLEEDLLDELQLTLCPRLLGGGHGWLAADPLLPPGVSSGWRLEEQRLLEDDELLLRYRRGVRG
jgi:5-amino-6-(5-phosphoribosylamino)uracil reductase